MPSDQIFSQIQIKCYHRARSSCSPAAAVFLWVHSSRQQTPRVHTLHGAQMKSAVSAPENAVKHTQGRTDLSALCTYVHTMIEVDDTTS